jgi:metalloendopeptidase OMA1, mitochondrial
VWYAQGKKVPSMRLVYLAVFFFLSFQLTAFSQDCSPPPIVFNNKSENIFTPEQEMNLGDAMMEHLEKNYRVIDDASVNAYLQSIGDRISKHLPVTGIRFRFVVADLPATNAFALSGGRIVVTRKLISFVKSEDELAYVIGHELGHAAVRHGAIDMSRYFKQILGVTAVGDRRDVFDKYNRYLEAFRTKRVSFPDNHQDSKQLEADSIGSYAIYAAGYDPTAMTAFWKRLTNAKKVGFWGAFFGERRPADKRLEEMISAVKKIPTECLDKLKATAKADFETWRSLVINFSGHGAKESSSASCIVRPSNPCEAISGI